MSAHFVVLCHLTIVKFSSTYSRMYFIFMRYEIVISYQYKLKIKRTFVLVFVAHLLFHV